jgi:hypothetical protein
MLWDRGCLVQTCHVSALFHSYGHDGALAHAAVACSRSQPDAAAAATAAFALDASYATSKQPASLQASNLASSSSAGFMGAPMLPAR